MSDESIEARRPAPPRPLIAVVDTSVLVSRRDMEPIAEAAHDGYVIPIWSPCIISEAARVLTWRWLRARLREPRTTGRDAPLTRQLEAACSRDAKVWFGIMTAIFQVVDDRPPDERAWSPEVRDPWDVPIWNAAVRSHADFVVTSNLRDGPPIDADGRRTFGGVTFVGPAEFAAILDYWSNLVTTGAPPEAGEAALTEPLRDLLDDLLTRHVDSTELPKQGGQ